MGGGFPLAPAHLQEEKGRGHVPRRRQARHVPRGRGPRSFGQVRGRGAEQGAQRLSGQERARTWAAAEGSHLRSQPWAWRPCGAVRRPADPAEAAPHRGPPRRPSVGEGPNLRRRRDVGREEPQPGLEPPTLAGCAGPWPVPRGVVPSSPPTMAPPGPPASRERWRLLVRSRRDLGTAGTAGAGSGKPPRHTRAHLPQCLSFPSFPPPCPNMLEALILEKETGSLGKN